MLPDTCHPAREPRTRETLLEDADPQLYRQFVADIKETLPNASIFLPGTNRKDFHLLGTFCRWLMLCNHRDIMCVINDSGQLCPYQAVLKYLIDLLI